MARLLALLLAVSSAEECVLRAKHGCEPTTPGWPSWTHKALEKPTEGQCRGALKFWTEACKHHVDATFGTKIIFAQQTQRYTSTCSHVHCLNDATTGITQVHHHHLEKFGHKHICKHELHQKDLVRI
jgi:hypothetical protein